MMFAFGLAFGMTTDADALFLAARQARSQSAYARYARYATVVQYRNGARTVTRAWDTIEDLRRRLVHARALSRQDGTNPHVPHGINVRGTIAAGVARPVPPGAMSGPPPSVAYSTIFNAERADDPIGQLTLAVDQDFGLAIDAARIGATMDMSTISSSVVVLPHIGRSGTIARTYEVTDLGDAVEDGVALHHLRLRPLNEPYRNRLRELWLDAKTSLPVRAVVAGIGDRRPLDAVRWRVDFAQLEGGTYVARETALAPIDYGKAGMLYDVTITFTELHPTNHLTPEESLGLSGSVGTTDP
ncbi:MAG: outer membrane lipoprotein-sorting protein [Candidatus Eremiobacteraeota bacterium]|nr:outer membrane lipoprotein-sorting protein [Candidatus Eremiobacteraeota bacterium]